MSRFMDLMLIVLLLLVQVGCASMPVEKPKPLAEFPHRHNSFDYKQAWKATQTSQGIVVEGVLKNIRYNRMDNLEIAVSVQRDGKQISSEESYSLGSLDREEYRDFDVLLKQVTMAPGDLMQFIIKYNGLDGTTTFKWISDFKADAFTGVAVQKPEEKLSDD